MTSKTEFREDFIKKPIPREWWPDLNKTYEKRYFSRFPGEK
jgi:hypothetical protein